MLFNILIIINYNFNAIRMVEMLLLALFVVVVVAAAAAVVVVAWLVLELVGTASYLPVQPKTVYKKSQSVRSHSNSLIRNILYFYSVVIIYQCNLTGLGI